MFHILVPNKHYGMFSSTVNIIKPPNILQITPVKESNIFLVLSLSVPETLVKHICFYSASVSVQNLTGMSWILMVGRVTRSPHLALVH